MSRSGLGANYWKLWAASTVSNLGDGITLVAGPLLAASLTRDPLLVAGVALAQRLPWLLFSLISGALVDRLDRRLLMVAVDGFRTMLLLGLAFAVLFDFVSIPLLYAVFFLMGTAETLFDTASVSILPAVVPRESLEKANGRLFGAQIVANEFVAPPLGGFLFAVAASVPFFLDAGSFAAASALVLFMRGKFRAERPEGAPPTTIWTEISEGLRWLWGNKLLRTLAVTLGVMNLTMTATISIFVLFAQERLGLGPVGYGVLMTSVAVGGVAGSLSAEYLTGWLGAGTTMRVGLVIEALTTGVMALSREPLVVGAMLALFGFHAIVWNVITISLRQHIIPERLLGRVNSAYRLLGLGGMSVGALIGGVLARGLGLTAPFWFASASMVVLIFFVWRVISNRTVSEARAGATSA
ncbi:MAG: MFS transporter [Rubrobacteraceae bacterium]